jgi:hypothetical protein
VRYGILIALLALSACHPTVPPATDPGPFHFVIDPNADDRDVVCVYIPALPYDPSMVGWHCVTVRALRAWLGRQQAAE